MVQYTSMLYVPVKRVPQSVLSKNTVKRAKTFSKMYEALAPLLTS
jgi:hypothetical protein